MKKVEDVEMKDVSKDDKKEQDNNDKENKEKKEFNIYEELGSTLLILEKAINEKDIKLVGTAAKTLGTFRKHLPLDDFRAIFSKFATGETLDLGHPQSQIDVSDKLNMPQDQIDSLKKNDEIQVFFYILFLMKLVDLKNLDQARVFADFTYERIKLMNLRTLDHLIAKAYFFIARIYELQGKLSDIRGILYQAHRSASLRLDHLSQATLTNLILRSYIENNLYEQARNFISKSTFPENVSSNQYARYLYYLGRSKAIQLEYSDSQTRLEQAMRKAPEFSAKGFRTQVQKLLVIVELLMGDVPSRAIFSNQDYKKQLRPYFKIVQSVRKGDIKDFTAVVERYTPIFQKDKNYSLIMRLRHNVIKFGLRKINLAYSKISLSDICKKLQLESIAETESIVAKTIRDGVIEAIIDHEEKTVKTKPVLDVYTSNIPQSVFHKRMQYCLDLYTDAVKALEFPKKEKKEVDSLEDRKEELNEEELIASLDGDEDY